MHPTPLLEVVPDVWRWSVWNQPRNLWFNGHLLKVGQVLVAVDPVTMSEEVVAAISQIGPPSLCVISNRDHERAAAQLRDLFAARVLISGLDRNAVSVAAEPLDPGDLVADALVAIAVCDGKSAGELALHWPARGLLVLGDAAVGRPAGALSMLPADKFADLAAARAGVASLAALGAEIILVGDGDDVLTGGTAALRALGDSPVRAAVAARTPGC